jgi:hypothetical protein
MGDQERKEASERPNGDLLTAKWAARRDYGRLGKFDSRMQQSDASSLFRDFVARFTITPSEHILEVVSENRGTDCLG